MVYLGLSWGREVPSWWSIVVIDGPSCANSGVKSGGVYPPLLGDTTKIPIWRSLVVYLVDLASTICLFKRLSHAIVRTKSLRTAH